MNNTEKKTESDKGNFLIPLLLLLISIAVIASTFYGSNDTNLVTQTDSQVDLIESEHDSTIKIQDTVIKNSALTQKAGDLNQGQIIAQDKINSNPIENTDPSAITPSTEKPLTNTNKKTNITSDIGTLGKQPSVIKGQKTSNNVMDNSETVIGHSHHSTTHIQPELKTHHQVSQYSQSQKQEDYYSGVTRAQKQASQHYEMMLQRRKAYEQEILSRRQQHAAARAQREARARNFEPQKAVMQHALQEQSVTRQKIQEIHHQISALHEELHQILRQSDSPFRNSETNPHKYTGPKAEKI